MHTPWNDTLAPMISSASTVVDPNQAICFVHLTISALGEPYFLIPPTKRREEPSTPSEDDVPSVLSSDWALDSFVF